MARITLTDKDTKQQEAIKAEIIDMISSDYLTVTEIIINEEEGTETLVLKGHKKCE